MGLIVDLFAGGGGASLGIKWALGRDPDIAINHDPQAVAVHQANHPTTRHFCQDVWRVLPTFATQGQPVDLLWASPDCKHHSRAKGGQPKDQNIRDLAWVVVEWARAVKPNLILLENVEEFRDWGPLDPDGYPIKDLAGTTFNMWVSQIRRAGYRVEYRLLHASDYGAPTIRKRLFLVARRDGLPIVWPEPTHGPGRGHPYRTAAECIDWTIPCRSVFGRPKPLAENTLNRIAAGIGRFVLNCDEPYLLPYAQYQEALIHSNNEPMLFDAAAYSGSLDLSQPPMVAPSLVGVGGRAGQSRPRGVHEQMATITAKGDTALVSAFLAKHYKGVTDSILQHPHSLVATHLESMYGASTGASVCKPAPTITSHAHEALVASHITKFYGTAIGTKCAGPLHTITANGEKMGLVASFLTKYYGSFSAGQDLYHPAATITANDRLGLVLVYVHGEPYVMTDIALRMLQPRELFRAQGFPDSYIIDLEVNGKRLTKKDQVRLCGNSVCPPNAEALVRANAMHLIVNRAA